MLGKGNSITLTCCESEDEVAKTVSKRTAYVETGVNLEDLSNSLDGIKPIKHEKFTVYTLGRICILLEGWNGLNYMGCCWAGRNRQTAVLPDR